MTDETTTTVLDHARVEDFFEQYATALLERDEAAVARMYAVPGLILFPGTPLAVTERRQTEEFFASAWAQYDGVRSVGRTLRVLAEAPGSTWADIAWTHDGVVRERFCYQLVEDGDQLAIAVLTPLALPAAGG